jgi:hypothetical protein
MAMIPLKPLEPETTLCTLPPGEDAGLIFEIPIEPPGDGADGLSAYQVAVANGFVGNEAAWLAALVGSPSSRSMTKARFPKPRIRRPCMSSVTPPALA